VDLEQLLQAVAGRSPAGDGISPASAYVSAIGSCLGDDGCAATFFRGHGPAEWQRVVKEAAGRLTYRHPDMGLDSGLVVVEGGTVRQATAKAFGKGELTPGACMDFRAVVTTTAQDRDADVLDTAGAEPDKTMPLLWQHIPLLPCGRMLDVAEHTKQSLLGDYSIVDSRLGNDAAQLVEFRAVHISHGFLPLEYQPRKARPGDKDPRDGWLVKRFKILETSLVSVRSNEDATVTLWSRGKLTHPVVKAYAEGLRRSLSATAVGGWDRETGPGSTPAAAPVINVHVGAAPHQKAAGECAAGCSCGGQVAAASAGDARTKAGEHAYRLADPANYDQFRRNNKKTKDGKTVGLIFGKLKGGQKWELQSIRYPKADWTPAEAKAACEGKDGKFDPAKRYGAFLPAGWRAGAGAWEEDAAELKQAGPLLLNTGGIPIPHLDGSYEELSADLDSQARAYLRQAGLIIPDGGEVTLLGTFDGYGVIVVRRYYSYGDGRNTTAYRMAWKLGDGGEPAWDGVPEPVDLVVTVEPEPAGSGGAATPPGNVPTEAALETIASKAATGAKGRLARKHQKALSEARDLQATVKGAAELKPETRAIAEKVHAHLHAVVEDVRGADGGRLLEAAAASMAKGLLGLLWQGRGGGLDADTAEALADELKAFAGSERARLEAAAVEQLLGVI
jgi:hypothetical protein